MVPYIIIQLIGKLITMVLTIDTLYNLKSLTLSSAQTVISREEMRATQTNVQIN